MSLGKCFEQTVHEIRAPPHVESSYGVILSPAPFLE